MLRALGGIRQVDGFQIAGIAVEAAHLNKVAWSDSSGRIEQNLPHKVSGQVIDNLWVELVFG